MSAYLSPAPFLQFFDASGNLLSGGQLFTYANNTDTPLATYTDGTGETPNTNPIILDAYGSANVWLPAGQLFTFVLSPSTDTNPPTNPIRVVNNVGSGGSIATINFATDTGVTNACIAIVTGVVSLFAGLAITIDIANNNTGPATLNVNGLGAKSIVLQNGEPLGGGELMQNGQYLLQYTGIAWQILGFSVTADKELTEAESSLGVSPTSFTYSEGDIRRYGALEGATDNSVAINTALLVSAAGGSAAYIPPGTWNYTQTVSTGNSTYGCSSMYGAGRQSILAPGAGIDGLTFVGDPTFSGSGSTNSPGASRFFRDFAIIGPSITSSQSNGIVFPNGITRLGGIKFDNLTIQNFAYGVNMRMATNGLWISAFQDCYLFNCYYGYYFFGECVQIQIVRGQVQASGMAAPSGAPFPYSIGIAGQPNGGSVGPTALTLDCANVYGFGTSVYLNGCQNYVIREGSYAIFNQFGFFLGLCQGGAFVKGAYLQAEASANNVVAINIEALSSSIVDKLVVEGCEILGGDPGGTGTIGISVGLNQNGVTLRDNTVGNALSPFVYGISGNNGSTPNIGVSGNNAVIEGNTIQATNSSIILWSSITNPTVRANTTATGVPPLTFSAGTPSGLDYSFNGTPMKGTTGSLVGVTSQVINLNVSLPAETYQVFVSPSVPAEWGVSSTLLSSFTVSFSSAFTGTFGWEIRP